MGNTLNREDVWLRRMHGLEKENGLHYTTAVVAQSRDGDTLPLSGFRYEPKYATDVVGSRMGCDTLPIELLKGWLRYTTDVVV